MPQAGPSSGTRKEPPRQTPAPVCEAWGAGDSADSRSLLAPARPETSPACDPSRPLGVQGPL